MVSDWCVCERGKKNYKESAATVNGEGIPRLKADAVKGKMVRDESFRFADGRENEERNKDPMDDELEFMSEGEKVVVELCDRGQDADSRGRGELGAHFWYETGVCAAGLT